jgi:TolB-like protein/Flp pilus assembly protein TadD
LGEKASPARGTIRFGVFELDLRVGELRKQGLRIRLQKQPFEVLQILLEHPGEVVSREELQQQIWPADTFVDFDQGLSNAIKRLREALCDSAESPRFIETVPRRGYRFIGVLEAASGRIESLVVLPLENLSGDPKEEYFADGMTEALITNLAKISALRITSRTSAMRYKGLHNKLVRDIAQELDVDGIVEGTVARFGDRVRISAQLINASTDAHLWAESYDRDMSDILALQSEVSSAIAREIRAKLTPREQEQLARSRPVNAEAYLAYLKGRHHWNRRNAPGLQKAVEFFQEAVDQDPTYAAAYAGLADCASSAGFWGYLPPHEGCGRAQAAARKSLEIEETAEAHASLGWASMHYDWDFPAAEREFERAIEINPRYASAHQWRCHCLTYVGRFDEALVAGNRALELDPLSLIINATYAGHFWLSRQWNRAIEHCRRALEVDATFTPLRWILAHAYQAAGAHEEAIGERQRAVEISGGDLVFVAELGGSYAAAGKRHEAFQILEKLSQCSDHEYVSPYWMATIYTGLQEVDEAFRWLEKAYEGRASWIAVLKTDARLDPLRGDPRYEQLIRRIPFPQNSRKGFI